MPVTPGNNGFLDDAAHFRGVVFVLSSSMFGLTTYVVRQLFRRVGELGNSRIIYARLAQSVCDGDHMA